MSAPKRIQLRRTKGWRKPDGVAHAAIADMRRMLAERRAS